ncbi:hypothetical protein BLNAU_21458 [Blattamonas nauphoetae]|uniref:DUF4371 domain-containing protein n=1 Tax=Blattamonas nauphoetae TaxID=2049346 RepID=A0ABQ9WVV3_9EUKA|nr:hypothetical protein BLNAU_21458 [Blattamonas nauphoetae]
MTKGGVYTGWRGRNNDGGRINISLTVFDLGVCNVFKVGAGDAGLVFPRVVAAGGGIALKEMASKSTNQTIESNSLHSTVESESAATELEGEERMIVDDVTEPKPAIPVPPKLKSADQVRHLYPNWIVGRDACLDENGNSIFTLSNAGIMCSICSTFKHSLKSPKGEYISRPSNPSASLSVYDHVQTATHKEALAMQAERKESLSQRISVEDTRSILTHRKNQLRAVNFIAINHLACDSFKALTNQYNSLNNPHFVTPSESSNNRQFWKLAQKIDTFFHSAQAHKIQPRTPLAITLDTSTDNTSKTILCVNCRFLSNDYTPVSLLLGLEEMKKTSTGKALFDAFLKVLTAGGIHKSQILCVSTDGDPAMNGSQKGFIALLRAVVPGLLYQHCAAHRFQLALKHSFESKNQAATQTLINNSIRFVHAITKSHSLVKKFSKALRQSGQKPHSLAKPIKIRWSTCRQALEDTLRFRTIISQLLQESNQLKHQTLIVYFELEENIARLAALLSLLEMTTYTVSILQSRTLTFPECRAAIQNLRRTLTTMEEDDVRNKLLSSIHIYSIPGGDQILDQMVVDFLQMKSILCDELESTFSTNDDTADLNFLKNYILLQPDTPQSDTIH